MEKKNNKKVIVALSGGVDSAVAAALLKKQGFQVKSVYFRFSGTWTSEVQAKKISRKLGIPLKIVDARKDFKKRVIKYFLDAHKKGLTPNPCVACNKDMKFRLLFDLAKKEKADYAATGHYARVKREFTNRVGLSNYKLLEAADKLKDQSYFLHKLTQKDLKKIIFPLGDFEKSEARRMAKKMGLPVAENESQDVCFIENDDINRFLKKNIKSKGGNIKDTQGNVIGKHEGLVFYTVGQRKGIKIGGGEPYFVFRKNTRKNELIVTNRSKDLLIKEFQISEANWVSSKVKFPLRAKIQIRYHAEKIPAIINKKAGGKYSIRARKALRAVTIGQSAVFYKKSEVLGGGVII